MASEDRAGEFGLWDKDAPSSDMMVFRGIFAKARNIVVLSGAGISAESGVPTFRYACTGSLQTAIGRGLGDSPGRLMGDSTRVLPEWKGGAGGYWRTYQAQQLATMESFVANPSLVWEFYSYRREVMHSKSPNAAHKAIAELEARLKTQGRNVTVITQNIDRLHFRAGSQKIIELHGSLFHTRCTKCGVVEENNDSPICPALKDKGAPDPNAEDAKIPILELPRCKTCSGLLRPHVVWFGEALEWKVLEDTDTALAECDLCLLVGTSSVVYPAAGFAPMLAARGVPVAEFNLEETPVTGALRFHFQGKCGETLPPAVTRHPSEPES